MQLNINTNAVVEKMHKSAFPSAVRGALNKAVFDVKKNTMPSEAKKAFTQRSPNFFKANSRFENAQGFNVNSMKATVGFIPIAITGKNNHAVEDLEQQENSGTIEGRSYIAMKKARMGKGLVRSNARMAALKNNIIDANKGKAKTAKQRYIRAAIMAVKLGKFVLGNKWKGNQTLSRIDGISSTIKTRNLKISRIPLYTFRKNRKITVAGTNFMKRASYESGLNIEKYYIQEAIRQFKKFE